MKPRTPGERTQSAEHAASALAGVIGHELNNIAVPLEWFAEMALQDAGAKESAGPMLDEIRIAVSRIKSLASDLESLGEGGTRPMPVAIGACLPDANGADASMPRVDWRCSETTEVAVDPVHARRALQALAGITGQADTPVASLPGWSIARAAAGTARCAACGAIPPRKDHIVVQVFSSRAVPLEALKDPFGSARVERASRRLELAVFVHSTHCAGGHNFLDESAGSISLAFPVV
jgi:hypothetical protein